MILVIDGMNFAHRARSGFQRGGYSVVYNVFRQLRAQVELHSPSRVIMTMEGHPKKRHQLLESYKANRVIDVSTDEGQEKQAIKQDFYRQAGIAFDLLQARFPVSIMRHPDHEADDLVHNLVKNAAKSSEYTIVSTDTDFIQMLQRFSNVNLYNPVTKALVGAPDVDYVFWKSLRGDGSDNVPGIPGITDEKARQLMESPDELRAVLQEHSEAFSRNVQLIKFMDFSEEELLQVESSTPTRDWDDVARSFDSMGFKSILKEPYWARFTSTFDSLW